MLFKISIRSSDKYGLIVLILCSIIVFKVSLVTAQQTVLEEINNYNPNNDGMSVILMIGDGMGYEHVKLARLVEVGKDGQLNMDELPITADVTTSTLDGLVTDSPASATAMATGNKTTKGRMALSPTGQILPTILEYANEIEKSTGVVTNAEVVDATSTAFYAHAIRYDYSEIIDQLTDDTDVDILMGGGNKRFEAIDYAKMRMR